MTDELAALRARVAELEARSAAAIKRIGDLKAVHSRWYDGVDRSPESNIISGMEGIAYSVACYLNGEPGPYRQTPPTPDPRDARIVELEAALREVRATLVNEGLRRCVDRVDRALGETHG